MLPDFEIINKGKYTEFLDNLKITTFHQLCDFVQNLPYGRTGDRNDFSKIFVENKGTCSSKHGFLIEICEINQIHDIELLVGIFIMNEEISFKVGEVLHKNQLNSLPEAHCYLRYNKKRYDFTGKAFDIQKIEQYIVREQRCESQQVIDWKPMIHKNYIETWLKRNAINLSLEKAWLIREECILAFSN